MAPLPAFHVPKVSHLILARHWLQRLAQSLECSSLQLLLDAHEHRRGILLVCTDGRFQLPLARHVARLLLTTVRIDILVDGNSLLVLYGRLGCLQLVGL